MLNHILKIKKLSTHTILIKAFQYSFSHIPTLIYDKMPNDTLHKKHKLVIYITARLIDICGIVCECAMV